MIFLLTNWALAALQRVPMVPTLQGKERKHQKKQNIQGYRRWGQGPQIVNTSVKVASPVKPSKCPPSQATLVFSMQTTNLRVGNANVVFPSIALNFLFQMCTVLYIALNFLSLIVSRFMQIFLFILSELCSVFCPDILGMYKSELCAIWDLYGIKMQKHI